MFAKLLKHEWNETWNQLGWVSVGALGTGALGAIVMRLLANSLMEENSDLLSSVLGITMVFVFLALAAYVIGAEISLYYRYYKHKFTDEGYLTFTLPVKPRDLFLSSLLNIVGWMAIVAVVSAVSVGLIILVGLADVLREGLREAEQVLGDRFWQELGFELPVGQLIASAVSFVAGHTLVLACVTMGCTFAKKHKILASIAIFYGVNLIQGVISGMVTMGAALGFREDWALTGIYLLEALIQTVFALGGSLLSVYLLNKELNLP